MAESQLQLAMAGGHHAGKENDQAGAQGRSRGKSPSTQAGEFVHEEIEHVKEGKHGARSTKQAIAIGLSKARRAGVNLPPPKGNVSRKTGAQASAIPPGANPDRTARRQRNDRARKRTAQSRSQSARKAARTRQENVDADGLADRSSQILRDNRAIRMSHLRIALRMLAREPGFTLTAAILLALGIGATTAIYTLLDRLLFEPLAYPESSHLVWIQGVMPRAGAGLGPMLGRGLSGNSRSFAEFRRRRRVHRW